jgi:hypothetical protein
MTVPADPKRRAELSSAVTLKPVNIKLPEVELPELSCVQDAPPSTLNSMLVIVPPLASGDPACKAAAAKTKQSTRAIGKRVRKILIALSLRHKDHMDTRAKSVRKE